MFLSNSASTLSCSNVSVHIYDDIQNNYIVQHRDAQTVQHNHLANSPPGTPGRSPTREDTSLGPILVQWPMYRW